MGACLSSDSMLEYNLCRGDKRLLDTLDEVKAMYVLSDPSQPDSPLIHVSKKFVSFTGYDESEILGKNCRFLQGPHSRAEDRLKIRTAIEQRKPTTVCILNYTKSERMFWNHFYIRPLYNPAGEVVLFLGIQSVLVELPEGADPAVVLKRPAEDDDSTDSYFDKYGISFYLDKARRQPSGQLKSADSNISSDDDKTVNIVKFKNVIVPSATN